jgi:hypothetical protein
MLIAVQRYAASHWSPSSANRRRRLIYITPPLTPPPHAIAIAVGLPDRHMWHWAFHGVQRFRLLGSLYMHWHVRLLGSIHALARASTPDLLMCTDMRVHSKNGHAGPLSTFRTCGSTYNMRVPHSIRVLRDLEFKTSDHIISHHIRTSGSLAAGQSLHLVWSGHTTCIHAIQVGLCMLSAFGFLSPTIIGDAPGCTGLSRCAGKRCWWILVVLLLCCDSRITGPEIASNEALPP